ncbi:type VI secretion system tube protein TssD [Mucilaginibacter lacusdianchii]|uniref:type VI secretion system tube protein TssD n=1 Tax=Mucilaginibacter lacusdianchii TaxID=2684211 RepID=UPI00131AEE79|nr:type VI secretion system tube protein TssD [Mucilaginibacter sp. JXJ CY 39]
MKNLFAFTLSLLSFLLFATSTQAQSDENRTKIQLTVVYGDKSIVTDLNTVSTSLSRSNDETPPVAAVKDSVKSKSPLYYPGSLYITMDAKKISDELLNVFSKKQNRFDGTITIVDTYGKNPTRTIKFKQASLYSYADQMSTSSYSDAYGASSISFGCKEISINGITIEQ